MSLRRFQIQFSKEKNFKKIFRNTPISEQQKKRDADRKARLAELRAKKLAMKQAMENAEE